MEERKVEISNFFPIPQTQYDELSNGVREMQNGEVYLWEDVKREIKESRNAYYQGNEKF